jgi:cytidine deaminase
MEYSPLDSQDVELIEAAADVIRRNYVDGRHSVGAALRGASGRIYTGVNIESCAYGPCAEPIALGAAISSGEREFTTIVAVIGGTFAVLPPCGNCRQMLVDYAPDILVILERAGQRVKTAASALLPAAYKGFLPG